MVSTLAHLRFPFSYFLLPVYLFALAISPNLGEKRLLWSFIIIHVLLYPASNGYNSYFDKDEKSIGGLKNPPPVNKSLYYAAWALDVLAVGLGWYFINAPFALLLLLYGLVSKAYSHPSVRLKKYPIGGWLTVSLFQGFFTFLMCYVGINGFGWGNLLQAKVLVPATLSTVLLLGTYPMTQVYQHEEDAARGDRTLSLLLGIRGTFWFVLVVFTLATAAFAAYFHFFLANRYVWAFVLALAPVVVYFLIWFYRVYRHPAAANYGGTMWLNFLSATCLNAFFIWLFADLSHIGQL
ncbi:MAG: UbiA family prenyltransferase [Cyclobacteriaceae bacterium]|jgi:1,4-dihydroxy-2-naphthoate octaprenyltransferase|nr:UbiA family prenyltransferase [Cyclobacteriaceae bacterium]